nr:hypothetical protein [Tanacetum cinerariifolium]
MEIRRIEHRDSAPLSRFGKAAASKDDSPFLTILDDDEGLLGVLELQIANACHLKISAITPLDWKNHLDSQSDVELLDLHDWCYAKQAVIDNAVNRRSRELLKMIDQIRVECDVLKDREKERDQECEELKDKCEVAILDFDKNLAVNVLREKIASLSEEVKEHRANIDRTLLESQKWNANLDRAEVVSKVVPYVAMKLVNSDDMGRLIARLVSASIFYGRCQIFEEVAKMKDPFDITNVKAPTRTHVPASFAPSHKATPLPAPTSPPTQITSATDSVSKTQSPPPTQ